MEGYLLNQRCPTAHVACGSSTGPLAALFLVSEHVLSNSMSHFVTEGLEECIEFVVQMLRLNAAIPVEHEEQSRLHELDFGTTEVEAAGLRGDMGVVGPVLVLRGGVVVRLLPDTSRATAVRGSLIHRASDVCELCISPCKCRSLAGSMNAMPL